MQQSKHIIFQNLLNEPRIMINELAKHDFVQIK